MKIAIIILSLTAAFNVSAKSLSCTASLQSEVEITKSFDAAMEWMKKNKIKDIDLVPESFNAKPVAVDTRTVELDEDGDAELGGIIIEAYEKYGISYNYAAYAKGGYIVYVGAENEVGHHGSGVNVRKQTEVEFGSSSTEDGSRLELHCVIK